ncbi:MAG: hypothetical protein R3E79_46650 [Caldilineaceae bacterium]
MSELETFKPANYTAYLVRLWQESPQTPWRASAQSARTGEKVYFPTLAALFAFLQAQTVAGQRDVDELAKDES